MRKRRFLAAAALGVAAPWSARAEGAAAARSGPGLLTVAGAIPRANRGPLDQALDQLMVKHGVKFEKAWQFDAAMLARLPAVTIAPTLEYDAKPHRLSGPLLTTVAGAAGIAAHAPLVLTLRAIDGYTVAVSVADANRYRMIVATTLDGAPLSLGGLGPLWAVYDADRLADFKDQPLKERFAMCPWGMYFIDVKPL
ncbi:MAG TPA: molybdopterin-dependent oxidoreductase [Caldimonas sp.]|nr:molybdopterin-dependent oxidoreductase [Caldimonas sp.]